MTYSFVFVCYRPITCVTIGRVIWVKKRIERAAKRLFLGAEDRGLQFLNSVKKEAKNVHLV